jgi:hypothetical protein
MEATLEPKPAEPPTRAGETQRAYRCDWHAFATWCAAAGQSALPATHACVLGFLTARPDLSAGTLARRAAAIAARHRAAGLAPPTNDPAVTALLRATRGQSVRRQRPRPRPAQLGQMAAACPRDLAGLRDRALLLLAAAPLTMAPAEPGGTPTPASRRRTCLTRVRLVTLAVEQLCFVPHALELRLPDAAPDDAGPRVHTLPLGAVPGRCPVRALQAWLQASDTRFGPVFRKVDRWGNVEHRALGTDAVRRILARRSLRRVRRRTRATP